MLSYILHILFYGLFIVLTVPVLYFFVMAIAGKLRKPVLFPRVAPRTRIAVLIPAYQEDAVIVETCRSITSHDYPNDQYSVFVAAHKLLPETLDALYKLPLQVIEIAGDYGSKALSLQALLNSMEAGAFDLALILDADNILEPGGLMKLNEAFSAGNRAIQLHRVAKNSNTALSYLEAISEEVNNHLFRQGPRALKLSASTIGSGMAFPIAQLKRIYNLDGIVYNPACDRIVDFEMMKANIDIEYLDEVYVLDEKVSDPNVFRKQRTRWIESQLIHIKLFFSQINKLNLASLNVWNKLISNLFPPRVLILGLLIAVNLLSIFPIVGIITPSPAAWIVLLSVYIITLVFSIPPKFYTINLLKAILISPVAFINMLRAVVYANPKRKEFIRTPKSYKENDLRPKS